MLPRWRFSKQWKDMSSMPYLERLKIRIYIKEAGGYLRLLTGNMMKQAGRQVGPVGKLAGKLVKLSLSAFYR